MSRGSFPIFSGVNHRYVLVPTLFSIFFSVMPREAKEDLPDDIRITEGERDRRADGRTDRQTGRQAGRQAEREAGRQAEREAGRQAERERERELSLINN